MNRNCGRGTMLRTLLSVVGVLTGPWVGRYEQKGSGGEASSCWCCWCWWSRCCWCCPVLLNCHRNALSNPRPVPPLSPTLRHLPTGFRTCAAGREPDVAGAQTRRRRPSSTSRNRLRNERNTCATTNWCGWRSARDYHRFFVFFNEFFCSQFAFWECVPCSIQLISN